MRLHPPLVLALALAAAACSSDKDEGGGGGSGGSGAGNSGDSGDSGDSGSGFDNPPGSGSGSGAQSGDADGGPASGPTGVIDDPWETPPELQLCDGACQCTDGIDNDGDGTADGFDTECTGGNDNDEGTFATGIPGDNVDPKWQDCFYDGDSGAGNDGCRYATECLTGEYEDDHPDCTVTQMCIDYCQPRTPNGCDCFGCCTFTVGGNEISVVLTADCEEENLDECTACEPAPMDGCSNECGRCELCPGRTVDDLPDDCGSEPPPEAGTGGTGTGGMGGSGDEPPPPGYECEGGLEVCTDSRDCQTGYFCSFGCCLIVVR